MAEALSFINASRKLHISQPALSAQIQALEAELGVALFERTRRSVRLTRSGETFVRDATAILQMVKEAEINVQRAAAGKVGHLRIGFVASAALAIVPSVVLAFRRRYPLVTLDLMNIRTTDQIALLEERELDAGFLRLPASSKALSITPIHREPFVLVVPNGHRLANNKRFSLAELEGESFVAYARRWAPGFYDCWIQMFTSAGFSPAVVQETGEMETMLALVAAGVGIAVAPRGLVRKNTRSLAVRSLPRGAPFSEIGLAVPSGTVDVLIDRLTDIARSLGNSASA